MEQIRMADYMVHISIYDYTLKFEAYPIQDWEHVSGKKGFSYIDKENEPEERQIFEEGKCLKKFEGSFCWRGVWEGRLYFTDDEYWGEEISEMAELYNNHIVPWCKDYIKGINPLKNFDE
jgi:hypothetical protein